MSGVDTPVIFYVGKKTKTKQTQSVVIWMLRVEEV